MRKLSLSGETHSVQHHRAHIASVLAERSEWTKRVAGVSFDGTGYGDDGTFWGGEFFVGSLKEGFERVAHLATGGSRRWRRCGEFPVQAAAGFLTQLDHAARFYARSLFDFRHVTGARLNWCTSMFEPSRLPPWDGFSTPPQRFSALLETSVSKVKPRYGWNNLHASGPRSSRIHFPLPARNSISVHCFHLSWKTGSAAAKTMRSRELSNWESHRDVRRALIEICRTNNLDTIVLSGGVFQNELLLEDLKTLFETAR